MDCISLRFVENTVTLQLNLNCKEKKMKKLLRMTLLTVVLLSATLSALAQDPVHFSVSKKQVSPTEVDVVFSATIANGWHVYSTDIPSGGPTAANLVTEKAEGAQPMGKLQKGGKEINIEDPVFGMRVRFFEHNVRFTQRYKITGKTYHIKGYLEYGACNDEMCMPPGSVEFDYSGNGPDTPSDSPERGSENADLKPVASPLNSDTTSLSMEGQGDVSPLRTDGSGEVSDTAAAQIGSDLWKPVIKELNAFTDTPSNHSLWYIFLMGILGGIVALFTPCVWPIIPMTVSFFLHRTGERSKGIRDAVTYGISIIVIYMLLAIGVTVLFGPQRLNELATNAPFNIFFFLLLLVFALSFFGWFELTLPSSWGNKVDSKASATTGILSIFLMAFTLSLVSFSCTAPVIGLLLVEAATSGNWLSPAVGMFGFALALALPFTLFAMFPAWLKKAPKSGGWMNTIKVVLGFIELAFSLKFLSVADLAYGWGILDRETFLSLWIVIFLMMGLYLMGFYHFPHDDFKSQSKSVPSIMLGMCSVAFAIYMVPGLWGAPCKAVSAFAPPMYTQDFNMNQKNEVRAKYTSYEEGMAAAKAQGKPVMLDFTGFGCVNCRKMEAAVWTDPEVQKRLTQDYILISLYVDDKTPLAHQMKVKDAKGHERTLRTVGDKWAYLEETKFGFLAQPFYVTVDNDGKPLSGSFVYKEDIPGYLKFLDTGIENYQKETQQ